VSSGKNIRRGTKPVPIMRCSTDVACAQQTTPQCLSAA
jgi:hypothetical protein